MSINGNLASPKRRRTAGFTVVELLVVLGILALLIGILMPVIGRAKDASLRASCQSNLRQLQFAWMTYTAQHNGDLVGAETSGTGDWLEGVADTPDIIKKGLLFPYCSVLEVYHCPADHSGHLDTFSINTFLNGRYAGHAKVDAVPAISSMHQISKPAETICFIEEYDHRAINMGSFVIPNNGDMWIDYPATFHRNGSSVGFCDGHVEFWTYSDSRTTKLTNFQVTPNNADLARFEAAAGY